MKTFRIIGVWAAWSLMGSLWGSFLWAAPLGDAAADRVVDMDTLSGRADRAAPLGDAAADRVVDMDTLSGRADRAAPTDTSLCAVRIEGYAPEAAGRTIIWKKDKDVFSEEAVEIARAVIGEDGRFVMCTDDVATVTPGFFCIDYYSQGFIAEPARTYRVVFKNTDFLADEKINPFIESNRLPELRYELMDERGADRSDLNFLIGRFSHTYQEMLSHRLEAVRTGRDTVSVPNYLRFSAMTYDSIKHPYFRQYRLYAEATLKQFARLENRRQLFEHYIDGRRLDVNNPAQVDFYKNYFEQYFQNNRFLPFNQTKRMVEMRGMSAGGRVEALLDSMGLDYALRNERLREWVMIYGLSQLWGDARIAPAAVSNLLRYVADSSKFAEHRRSAAILLDERKKDYTRRFFTGVELSDPDGNSRAVDSLLESGRLHYFCFVRADYDMCPSCDGEMEHLRKMWGEAGSVVQDKLRIIVINADYARARYVHHARRKNYPWPYYHFNGQIDWMRRIDAASFPAFILVDDKGRILDGRAPAPSEGLRELFMKIGRDAR